MQEYILVIILLVSITTSVVLYYIGYLLNKIKFNDIQVELTRINEKLNKEENK